MLKAAELHGATHQAVIEFQVIATKRLPKITVGRSPLVFYYRKDMEPVSRAIAEHKTDTGSMKVSLAELTALDLLRYPHAAAGFGNIVTVLADLGGKIDPEMLASLSGSFPKSVVQRLGHLLDRLGHANSTQPMFEELIRGGLPSWVELDPEEVPDPELGSGSTVRDKYWNVVIRREPEVDE